MKKILNTSKRTYMHTIIEEGNPRCELSYTNKDYVYDKLDAYGIKIVPDSHITIVRTMSSEMNSRYVYYFLKYNHSNTFRLH